MYNSIKEKIDLLNEKINNACHRSGRNIDDVKIMGVSKFQNASMVRDALNGGLDLFGESRVQEAVKKFNEKELDLFWDLHKKGEVNLHFIGNLQRNKAKTAASFFDCIQSLDRDSLIEELGNITSGRKEPLMVLFEYNSGDEKKAGYKTRNDLYNAAEKVLQYPGLALKGLMTLAPYTDDKNIIRKSFRELYSVREELIKRFSIKLDTLSMGMTGDFEIAIEEGSTIIRIGSFIFGERA